MDSNICVLKPQKLISFTDTLQMFCASFSLVQKLVSSRSGSHVMLYFHHNFNLTFSSKYLINVSRIKMVSSSCSSL